MTRRARETLEAADIIACEDTRVTRKLLAAHDIATPLVAYHEHNAERVRPRLIEQIKSGQKVALVSDAGTPLISDPGYKLVRAVLDEGLEVTALPGPSAPLTALVVSGLPSDRFFFAGFLPAKAGAKRKALEEVANLHATLIFFESAQRLAAALRLMAEVLGDRPAAVARELTKKFEEVRRAPLSELAAHYEIAGAPKGEIVLVVGPPGEETPAPDSETLDRLLREALARGTVKTAAAEVAARTGLSKRDLYQRALTLRDRGDDR